MTPFTPHDGGVTVTIRLTPAARQETIGGLIDIADGKTALKASVRAVPEDGKANAALIALLASALKLPKRAVSLVSGGTSRQKILRVEGDAAALLEKLEKLKNPT